VSAVDELDLSSLSYAELKALNEKILEEMPKAEERSRRDFLEEMQRVAKDHNMTLNELVDLVNDQASGGSSKRRSKGNRKQGKLPPKYAHPNDPSITWSGKGRRPEWFVHHTEAGNSEDDLLIRKAG
jgi:DNA-binding protein H-NS